MISNLLFYSIFLTGLFTVLLSKSFMWIWLRIELVSLRVAVFILVNSSVREIGRKKRSLLPKYLIAQFVAGGIVLRSSFVLVEWWHVLFILALSLKLRLVPLHSWVIDIFGGISLIECFVLRVVSKIGPLLVLLHWAPDWCFNIRIISILGGSFIRIIYRDLRHILRCSSIIGTGWLCVAASFSTNLFVYSFVFYTLSNLILFWALDQLGTYNLSDRIVNLVPSYKMKIMVSFILIRNVRLPIFLFFIVKMLVIIETKWYFLIILVLILRRISIVWYARVINVIWSYERRSALVWHGMEVSSLFFSVFIISGISSILLVVYLICWISIV